MSQGPDRKRAWPPARDAAAGFWRAPRARSGDPRSPGPSPQCTVKKEATPSFFFGPHFEAGFGTLKPILQPFFPDWKNVFSLQSPQFRPGIYVIKVVSQPHAKSDPPWRRLAIPSGCNLHDLSEAVLTAFEFTDWDHQYFFEYRDRLGKLHTYFHPFGGMPPFANDVAIGQVELPYQETIHFRFDFGDKWDFHLKLDQIKDPDPDIAEPVVIESKGESPSQYW